MLDVEFLLIDPADLPLYILYIYDPRSAALRTKLLEHVITAAENRGLFVFWSQDAPASVFSPGLGFLFSEAGTYTCCDAGEYVKAAESKAAFLSFLGNEEQPRLLMMPRRSFDRTQYALPSNTTIVEEPILTEATVGKVQHYLQLTSRFYDFNRLDNKQIFSSLLRNYVGMVKPDMLSFMKKFTGITLADIDTRTNEVNANSVRLQAEIEGGMLSTRQLLNALIRRGDSWTGKALLLTLDRRLNEQKMSVTRLKADLHRSTARLLNQPANRVANLFWALLLISWDTLLCEGPFVFASYKLCQAFRREKAREFADQGLVHIHWGTVTQHMLEALTDDLRSARRRLVERFVEVAVEGHELLDFVWGQRLRSIAVALGAQIASN